MCALLHTILVYLVVYLDIQELMHISLNYQKHKFDVDRIFFLLVLVNQR